MSLYYPEYNIILCRYSEIALKGKNRWIFEQRMIDRINRLLNKFSFLTIRKIRGRIVIHFNDYSCFTEDDMEKIGSALKRVFGLDSFSFAIKTDSDIESIRKKVDESCEQIVPKIISLKKTDKLTFRIRVRRSNKHFPMTTKDTEIDLSDIVYNKNKNFSVNLDKADLSVYCEIHTDYTFIFYDKEFGPGGLPSGSNPPVLSLLSGGFDSPVASYMIMKRGVFVDFLSFHSFPFTPQATVDKVRRLAGLINRYQGPRRLFLCNLLEVQKILCAETYETFRTIYYRRFMFRLAEKIAYLNGNKALVTGESVGQVASQTIVNLSNIDSAIEMLVLRPLIGMDKIEIMRLAEKIGTFEASKLQVPDSCTVFSPSNPSTGAPRKMIINGEKRLDIEALVNLAYQSTVVIDIDSGEETPIDKVFGENSLSI